MGDVNFIPVARLASKHCKARLHIWAVICGAYLTSLSVVSLSAYAFWVDNDDTVTEELTSTAQSIQEYNSAILELRKGLAEAATALQITRAVGSQPDWSKLLILISSELGEGVVLNKCQLVSLNKANKTVTGHQQELSSSSPAGVLLAEQRYKLSLSGFGRTQTSVSQFVLRLEKINIFESVGLIDSSRQRFLDDEAVTFSIECRF
jgi:hypothetical protein